ncbi:hypothetical protein KIPB_011080, partial [Kipferlia bialata]|eukprot:g11080.t1
MYVPLISRVRVFNYDRCCLVAEMSCQSGSVLAVAIANHGLYIAASTRDDIRLLTLEDSGPTESALVMLRNVDLLLFSPSGGSLAAVHGSCVTVFRTLDLRVLASITGHMDVVTH